MNTTASIQESPDSNNVQVSPQITARNQSPTAPTQTATSTFTNTTSFEQIKGLYYPSGAESAEESQIRKIF